MVAVIGSLLAKPKLFHLQKSLFMAQRDHVIRGSCLAR
jgi:hypothetical protein